MPEETRTPAQWAAYHLIECHEDATRNGYPRDDQYPFDTMIKLADDMYVTLGQTVFINRWNIARALLAARQILASTDNGTIYRIEVLETRRGSSFCGHYLQDASLTGPSSDDEADIVARAQEMEKEGHFVRVVSSTTTTKVTWTGSSPWSDPQ